MASAEAARPVGTMAVEVAWSPGPRQVQRVALQLPAGSTALQALRDSGLAQGIEAAVLDGLALALWGRVCEPGTVLRDGDRLELLRPLVVDPKEARRLRYRRDGLRKKPPRKR